MVAYGEHLKTSVQNLAQWTQQLKELVPAILDSPTRKNISDLVALTEQMLIGIDLDDNDTVDPIAGESGAQFAYQYAYSMANMPLINVGFQNLGTGTPVFVGATSNASGSGGNTGPTPKPGNTPPGQIKTDKPDNPNKPPNKDGNGGNNP